MTSNLAQMIKTSNTSSQTIQAEKIDPQTEAVALAKTSGIEIVSLSEWFEVYVKTIANLRKVTVSIQGVDPAEQLIITVANPQPGREDKRKLVVFEDANITPVLNLPPLDMQVYNNGFRIIYEASPEVFIKCYGIRTGLISIFCNAVEGLMVPYTIVKSKKKDTHLEIPSSNIEDIKKRIKNPVDLEALQLLYKQSVKAENLNTVKDAVAWLLERQIGVEDVNHHMMIDNTIISITS